MRPAVARVGDVRSEEYIVLCGPDGSAIGKLPKSKAHHRDTPLHLAFSCYVFDSVGRLLVTRRALTKLTWPGARTNSCCGHPMPGEAMGRAIRRRLGEELGICPDQVDLVLPQFAYRAEMPDGTVENELCPVYRARIDDPAVAPDPSEVHETEWVPWPEFVDQVSANERSVSPWCASQVVELNALGPNPLTWPMGAAASLPAAAIP